MVGCFSIPCRQAVARGVCSSRSARQCSLRECRRIERPQSPIECREYALQPADGRMIIKRLHRVMHHRIRSTPARC